MELMHLNVINLKKCVKIHYHKWLSRLPKVETVKCPVYNLRIHVNLSTPTNNPKFNLLRWKKTFPV